MKTHTAPKKASQGDWHPADIVAALHKRGLTLREVARQSGVSHEAVIAAMRHRRAPSEKRIANALGVHPMVIWPTRYEPDGSRRYLTRGRHVRKTNGNALPAAVNGKDGGVK